MDQSKEPRKLPLKSKQKQRLVSAFRDRELVGKEIAIRRSMKKEEQGKITILAVDDYQLALRMYEDFLTQKGYRVLTASNGQEALATLVGARIDLAILDYNLPGMNGIQILEKIRASHPNLPVIMITGNDTKEVVEEAIHGGISSYLLKPVKNDLLLERIQSALKQVPPKEKEPPPLV